MVMSDTPIFDTLNSASLFPVTEPIETVVVTDDEPVEPDLEPDVAEPAYAEAPADAPGENDDIPFVEEPPVDAIEDDSASAEFPFPEVIEAEVPEFTLDVPPADAGEIEVETEEGAEHAPAVTDPNAPFLPTFDDVPLDPNFDPEFEEPVEVESDDITDEEIAQQAPWG